MHTGVGTLARDKKSIFYSEFYPLLGYFRKVHNLLEHSSSSANWISTLLGRKVKYNHIKGTLGNVSWIWMASIKECYMLSFLPLSNPGKIFSWELLYSLHVLVWHFLVSLKSYQIKFPSRVTKYSKWFCLHMRNSWI